MERCALFISTLNEVAGTTKLFDAIPISSFDECFCLDGGSTDGTSQFLSSRGIRIVSEVKKGEIFNVAAMVTTCEELVFFAPDGNENPDEILQLLDTLRSGYDMVIASRFLEEARNEEDDKLFKWRKWANQCFTWLVRMRWGGHITDTINGFRAVKRSKLIEMNTEPTGFDIEFQMSIRALKLGHRVTEIQAIEGDRIGGKSTAESFPTGLLMARRFLKELFNGMPLPPAESLATVSEVSSLRIESTVQELP